MGPTGGDQASRAARLSREIEHDRRIASRAEGTWNWDSPAGRRRADRRASLLVERAGLGPGVRALELGCGTGVFLDRVARSGATLHGIDLSAELLAQVPARPDGGRPRLVRGDAERLPFPDGSFDAVYGSSVLHHLHLDAALAEVLRVLRPGGCLAFAEPNLVNPHVAFIFAIAPRERFGVSPDEMAFTRVEARRALARAGFAEVRVDPFDFLHPAVPGPIIEGVLRVGQLLERLPLLREIAGSLLLSARKP
jgi:SAM-dependent methyltransferase